MPRPRRRGCGDASAMLSLPNFHCCLPNASRRGVRFLKYQGLSVVTLNEVKSLKSLCENKAAHSQQFWISRFARNDKDELPK